MASLLELGQADSSRNSNVGPGVSRPFFAPERANRNPKVKDTLITCKYQPYFPDIWTENTEGERYLRTNYIRIFLRVLLMMYILFIGFFLVNPSQPTIDWLRINVDTNIGKYHKGIMFKRDDICSNIDNYSKSIASNVFTCTSSSMH